MGPFRKKPPLVLWHFPVLLLLSGCGETGPECGSADARNSVIRIVAENRNNALVNFAASNSDSVGQLLSQANSAAEKAAILEQAKQGAIYFLNDTVANSIKARTAFCTGLLSVTVGDTTAQKEVEFRVEQAADGKASVSVSPFLF